MKTIEELSKELEGLSSFVGVMKKDFELKLGAAKTEATEWKTVAEKKEAEAKQFKEAAEKAEQDKIKAYQESRIKEMKSFLEESVKTARITPASKVLAEKLMESMTSDATVHTFEDKDGKKTSHTQFSLFKEFVNSLAKSKVFSTLTPAVKQTAQSPIVEEGDKEIHFQEVKKDGATQNLIVDDYEIGVKALDYQAEMLKIGRKIDYADALIAVTLQVKQAQE